MRDVRMPRLGLGSTMVLLWAVFFLPTTARSAERIEDLRSQARQHEKEGDWGKACAFYAYILSKDRTLTDVRERFQTCLRHFHRVRRHQDTSYRQQVLGQDVSVALKVYGEVLDQLRLEYLEEDKVDVNRLFHQGLHELRLALADEAFCRQYLPDTSKGTIQAFLTKLDKDWATKDVHSTVDAQNQTMKLALSAKRALGLKPTVTVLEVACGACNTLDEHTYYLTPRQLGDDFASLRGEVVGVGIDLSQVDKKLMIAQVYFNSPAHRAGLMMGDRVLRIGNEPADKLSLEAAIEKLKGKTGSSIEIEVLSNEKTRTLALARQPINVSVTAFRMHDTEVGYIQVSSFHEHTLAEIDEAIRQLAPQGMKSLVLDLRGNSGGLLESAIQVAERFLWEGAYIVSTRGKVREVKRTSRNLNPDTIPLVVLVDGGTASAAEVLAGALKENLYENNQPRAVLVGQTTFGKGTIQHMIELKTVQAGGLRISWAKFFSPLNNPYQGFGVEPHLTVEPNSMGFDEQLRVAVIRAKLLAGSDPSMMMPR